MKGHGSDLDPTNRRTTMTNCVILTALTLAALSLSTAARTQDGPDLGPISIFDFAPVAADKDGKITEAELTAFRAAEARPANANADGKPDHRAMRASLQTIVAALRADPFARAALDTAMAAQVARLKGRIRTGQALLRDFLADQTPANRRAFADRL